MNYKFTEVRLNLETDTIDVIAVFKISKNQWQQKHYKYDAPEEIDIQELLDRTKSIIEND